ncbi:hypothetical protein EMCRGX_G030106 [Ephydatia muelleri]
MLNGASTVDKARLLAISAPQAHAWLRAQPPPKLGLDLLPNEVQALVKWWLGLPVFTDADACPHCSQTLDIHGHHALICHAGGEVVTRHNHLRDSFVDFCRRACLAPELERAFDLKVVNLLNTNFLLGASMTSGYTAELGEKDKHSKNDIPCTERARSTSPALVSEGLALFDAEVSRHFCDCGAIDPSDSEWLQNQLGCLSGLRSVYCSTHCCTSSSNRLRASPAKEGALRMRIHAIHYTRSLAASKKNSSSKWLTRKVMFLSARRSWNGWRGALAKHRRSRDPRNNRAHHNRRSSRDPRSNRAHHNRRNNKAPQEALNRAPNPPNQLGAPSPLAAAPAFPRRPLDAAGPSNLVHNGHLPTAVRQPGPKGLPPSPRFAAPGVPAGTYPPPRAKPVNRGWHTGGPPAIPSCAQQEQHTSLPTFTEEQAQPSQYQDTPFRELVSGRVTPYAARLPAKLVAHIESLEYVEMAELLQEAWLAEPTPDSSALGLTLRLPRRSSPITDISVWVECYCLMFAVLCANTQQGARTSMYLRRIVHCARKFEGHAWVTYDRLYRRQAAASRSLSWATED